MCIYMCVYVYVFVYVCVYTNTHIHTLSLSHTHIHINIYVCIHIMCRYFTDRNAAGMVLIDDINSAWDRLYIFPPGGMATTCIGEQVCVCARVCVCACV